MKKTLLAVMAGLTVVGAAFAAPTPEDRKKLCEMLMEKKTHVWVEKTQACIPSNPCGNDVDPEIRKAYCLSDLGEYFRFREEKDLRDFVVRYAVKSGFGIDYSASDQGKYAETYHDVWYVMTDDGGYFTFEYIGSPNGPLVNRKPVCLVFGRETSDGAGCNGVESEQECNDMSDYWNLLTHDQATKPVYDEQTKKCVF